MPAGWPKGKPRGPITREHHAKLQAGRIRAGLLRKKRAAEVSSGRNLGGGLNQDGDPRRAHISVSPAVWFPVNHHIGDCQYVDDGLDEVMLRALDERVVYGGSVCCHYDPPFQDITIALIAGADRQARKNGIPIRTERLPKPVPPAAPRRVIKRPPPAAHKEGLPLLSVVAEMFPEAAEGRPLSEVISELHHS